MKRLLALATVGVLALTGCDGGGYGYHHHTVVHHYHHVVVHHYHH